MSLPTTIIDMPDELIVEGLVLTQDAAGRPNLAPMGPRTDRVISRLVLRPFRTAQTLANLKATRRGVFHVTDDVELLARAAIGRLEPLPPLVPIEGFPCPRLADTCRWFAFRAMAVDESAERTIIECEVAGHGSVRPFLGFNRAKHAVLEAAILATRIDILSAADIQTEMQRLMPWVEKTGGALERRAYGLLQIYIHDQLEHLARSRPIV